MKDLKNIGILLLMSLILSGCLDSVFSPDKGQLAINLTWETPASQSKHEGHASASNIPTSVKVTLSPGRTYDFSYSAGSGTIDDLDPGSYEVTVNAYESDGCNTMSGSRSSVSVEAGETASASISMRAIQAVAPSGGFATRNDLTAVNLSWNGVSGAESYNIYWSFFENSGFRFMTNTSGTSFRDTDVTMAQWYNYRFSTVTCLGESPQSSTAAGYRIGWRIDDSDLDLVDISSGIGFEYDLLAYGFRGVARIGVLYAVYEDGGSYYFVPGNGLFGLTTASFLFTPSFDTAIWNDATWFLETTDWHVDWRDNDFPQYIRIKIFTSSSIGSLNDPIYDVTDLYSIVWSEAKDGKRVKMGIGDRIPADKVGEILMPEGYATKFGSADEVIIPHMIAPPPLEDLPKIK